MVRGSSRRSWESHIDYLMCSHRLKDRQIHMIRPACAGIEINISKNEKKKSMWSHITDITTSSWIEKQSPTLLEKKSKSKETKKIKRQRLVILLSSGRVDPVAQPFRSDRIRRCNSTAGSRNQDRLENGGIYDLGTLFPKNKLKLKKESCATTARTRTFGS